ncbi:MAG: hypothetical protein LBC76_05365 [Treponema sp.]|jgi:hypothetical protein|nr:hypothetical protein [Treponema sp.]
MAVSHSELPELDRIFSIAEDIAILKPFIRKNNGQEEPVINVDFNLAIDSLKSYLAVFGKEGLDYIENKFGEYYKKDGVNGAESYKYGFRTPNDNRREEADIKIIERLIDKIETPKLLKHENRPDKKAHYNEFVESEKKEITAFIVDQKRKTSSDKIDDYINSLNGNVLPKNNNTQTVKMPNQGETTPLERRDINNKENIMSDAEEQRELSPKEQAFLNVVHQRKVVADAAKTGTLSCLPGKDGYADTTPSYNILNPDKFYHGSTLLYLKEHQKQNGFPTGEYITYQRIEEARKNNPDLFIRKDQKGVSLHISEKNDVTGDYEEKHIRLFNVAQLNKPWEIKKWAEHKLDEDRQARDEYLKSQFGMDYKPPEPKPKEPGPEIVCSSTEPEKYLGQYLAAVSMGGKFKASPEQAAEFSEKMLKTLYAPMEPRINEKTGETIPPPENRSSGEIATNPFSLEKLSINANKECKEFMRDLKMQAQKQNQPEREQEQTQTNVKTW